MAWWDRIDRDRFARFHLEAMKRRPGLNSSSDRFPAGHIVAVQVQFPFTMTLDDYAAFLALSSEFLESNRRGAPITVYALGTTVLMWHAAIWDYMGQAINMICNGPDDEEKVYFHTVTNPKKLEKIPEEQLQPIPKNSLGLLAAMLRRIRKRTSVARQVRHIGTHRYHLASTYTTDFLHLLQIKSGKLHHERVRGLQENVRASFDALVEAENEFRIFLADDRVRQWSPPWFEWETSSHKDVSWTSR